MTNINQPGDGHRIGAVRERSQTVTTLRHCVKRDSQAGRFMDVKSDKMPFEVVRREINEGRPCWNV